MAINYNYAIKYSTSKIVSRAYREYATETAEAYGRLVGIVSQAVEYEINQNTRTATVEQAVGEILGEYQQYGYTLNSPVVLPSGAITLGDLLKGIVQHNIDADNAIDLETETPEGILNLVSEKGITPLSISGILTDLQNCFHAAVVDQGAAIAFDNGGSISEMVSMLRDSVMTVFSNGYTDFSNTLNSTINKLKSGMTVIEYIEQKLSSSGIEAAAERGETFDNSEDYTFTGSSVASAQSWKSAATQVTGAVGQAVRIAAQAVKTTIKGIINVGKKLFKKVVSKLRQIFVDPYDIEEINGTTGNNTVNGFQYQQQVDLPVDTHASLIAKLNKGPIHMDFIPCEMIMQLNKEQSTGSIPEVNVTEWNIDEFMSFEYEGSLTFDTLFANMLGYLYPESDIDQIREDIDYLATLNVLSGRADNNLIDALLATLLELMPGFGASDAQYLDDNPTDWNLLNLTAYVCNEYETAGDGEPAGTFVADLLLKVKPVDHLMAIGLLQSLGEHSQDPVHEDKYIYTLGDVLDVFDHIKLYDGAHTAIDRKETDLYLDFVTGVFLTTALSMILNYEAQGVDDEALRATPFITTYTNDIYSFFRDSVGDTVTNEQFFNLFTKFEIPNTIPTQHPTIIGAHVAFMLKSVFDYRIANPFAYEFFPYSQDYADWFPASFQLKSDQQNENAFVDFVSKAVLVIIVATIATTAIVTLRRLAMKADLKQKAAELIASDKAVVGRFDKKDLKNLRKATRRAKILKALTGGLTSTATQIGITDAFGSDVEPIVTLIRG